MHTEQAYINGFVKKAAEYGFDEDQAITILKQADNGSQAIRNMLAGLIRKPRRTMAGIGALGGGLAGGGMGGVAGGLGGLLNPGQEIDPATGQIVDKSRIMSALTGGLKGTVLGGGMGAAAGGIGGAIHGAEMAKMRATNPAYRKMTNDLVRSTNKATATRGARVPSTTSDINTTSLLRLK